MTMAWHPALEDVPKGPAIIIANEFFDALPINQAVKSEKGWHERQVGNRCCRQSRFHVRERADRAFRHAAAAGGAQRVGAVDLRMARRPFGHAARPADRRQRRRRAGDRLRAHRQRRRRHPAGGRPARLRRSADRAGQHPISPRMWISMRWRARSKRWAPAASDRSTSRSSCARSASKPAPKALKARAASRAASADIDAALTRLTGYGRTAMGTLFKVAAFAHPSIGVPPAFRQAEIVYGQL